MSETTTSTEVENEFFKTIGCIPRSLAYIPSKTDSQRKYFSRFRRHFLDLGVRDVWYCDFDQEYSDERWRLLTASACVYLSGGFTPAFLETLQNRGVLDFLKGTSDTKPIIGVSAGAIIMGKDITILKDSPTEGPATLALADTSGIGLFEFHFFPHFNNEGDETQKLVTRSRHEERPIVACDDQSGLVVGDANLRAIGKADIFVRGTHRSVKDSAIAFHRL